MIPTSCLVGSVVVKLIVGFTELGSMMTTACARASSTREGEVYNVKARTLTFECRQQSFQLGPEFAWKRCGFD